MSRERWAGNTQMSSWTCFRISQRAISRTSPRTDAETSSAWQEDRKMRGERKNAMRCVSKDNAVRERMQCGDFIGPPHWLFRADILHGPMQIYCNGCRRYLKRATQYYCYGNWDLFYSRKSHKFHGIRNGSNVLDLSLMQLYKKR